MPRMSFPSKESRETYAELAGILERYGVTEYALDKGGVHPCLVFKVKDQRVRLVFPGTGSDWRGLRNSRATLIGKLKEMGLEPVDELEAQRNSEAETESESLKEAPEFEDQPNQSEEMTGEPPPNGADRKEPVVEAEQAQDARESVVTEPESVWDRDTLVYFANKNLLYLPPQRPLLVLELDKDLMAERGDRIVIDLLAPERRVRHLPKGLADFLQLADVNSPDILEALKIITGRKQEAPETPPPRRRQTPVEVEETGEIEVEETQEIHFPRKGSLHGVGLQLGRVLVAMDYLHRTRRTDKIDTQSIAEVMPPRDKTSIASNISLAKNKKYVYTVGPKPGSLGKYYRLTEIGRKKARELGDEPFRRAGMTPPSEVMATE
jgi:hypothetical protein